MFNGFQPWHLLLILAAVVLIFGAKKLPEAARGIGRSMRILKSEVSAMHEDDAVRKGDAPDATTGANSTVPGATATPMVTGPATPAIAPVAPAAVTPFATPAAASAPVPAPATPAVAAPAAAPAVVQATTIDGKPAVIINGVPTLIDNQAT